MMMIKNRTIKTISNIIGTAILLVFVALCITVGVKNKKLKQLKKDIKQSELVIDSLKSRCNRLAEMDAIRVTTTFQIKNSNVLGIQKVGDYTVVAESYAAYTRQFLLDSVYAKQR